MLSDIAGNGTAAEGGDNGKRQGKVNPKGGDVTKYLVDAFGGRRVEGGDNRKTDFLPKPFQRPANAGDKQTDAEKPGGQFTGRVFLGSFEGILLCLEQHLAAHILAHERFVIERHLVI